MRVATWCVASGVVFALSCTTPAEPVSPNAATPVVPATSPEVTGASARPVSEEPADVASAIETPGRDTVLVAAAEALALVLPRDEAFVSATLPPQDPGRYSRWRETSQVFVGQSHLTQVDLLSNGEVIVLSTDEGAVRRYDRTSKRLLGKLSVPGFEPYEPVSVVAWPGPEPRYITGTPSGLTLVEARSNAESHGFDDRQNTQLRWSPDARVLVGSGPGSGEQTSVLHFWVRKAEGLAPIGSLAFDERVDAWASSHDNRLLAVTQFQSETVRVIDLHTGADVWRGAAPRTAGDVAFSPDGRLLAVGGDGLLLIDLINPDRRAFYSYVENNIGHVRFSPSGDAVFASSYDGRIRIFNVDGPGPSGLALRFSTALRHRGIANVYAFTFADEGRSILSVSGDQTLRTFSERGAPASDAPTGSKRRFLDLETWRHLDPKGGEPLPAPAPAHVERGMYFPPAFTQAARPSRIAPGLYACKITTIYRLRDCWVEQDAAGRTLLTFAPDNLLNITGVLYDDGQVVRYEAALREQGSVIACPGCDRQPLLGVLRGKGKKYEGVLTFRTYHDPYVPPPLPPANVAIEEANDRFPIVLEWRGPLPSGGVRASE